MDRETSFAQPPVNNVNMWQFSMPPNNFPPPQNLNYEDVSAFDSQDPFSQSTGELSSAAFAADPVPRFVQPQELHASSSSSSTSEASKSPESQYGSLDFSSHSPLDSTLSQYLSVDRQRIIRRLSLATSELSTDSYRPRNTPARPRKSASSRITPRSEKHARELELNRKAATKCRNRQKAFVENLQARCKREEEKMHVQTSLVHALHDEVVALRNEVMRQSFCDCRYLKGTPNLLST
ncbi:hypothetical protein LTS15_009732 [Exophiala xenobiotica]|nr:hypothetical protein LTS15_009732 [Exophiala xenobiotica]